MELLGLILKALVLNGLWQPALSWSAPFLTNFLGTLFQLLQTQELVWFLSEQMDTKGSENLQEFTVKMHKTMGLTQMVLSNRTDIRLIQTENKKNALSLVFTTGPDDFIMTVLDKVLLGRHMYFNIIVMVQPVHDFSVVEHFMYFMKQHDFQNSVLYYQGPNATNELYGYTLFPEYAVQNRSDFFDYMMRHFAKYQFGGMDTQLFPFESPLRQDVPGVFQYITTRGVVRQQGTAYKIIKLFIDYINATLKEYPMPTDALGGEVIDMREALNLVRERKVPLLVHAYALYRITDDIDKSYPIMVVRWCLMVPIFNSVSTFYYPVQPFSELVWYTWASVFIVLALLGLAHSLWQISRMGMELTWSALLQHFGRNIVNSFCFVVNIATPTGLQTPTLVRFLFYATVFFHGFFFSANYTSLLGSILTVTLFRAQINNMADLINANITVLIIDYELEFLLEGGDDLPPDFLRLLRPVDAATFNQHQTTLNRTYAYFITDEKWHFLQLQQRHLKQGLFKLTDICFGSYHLSYPMPPDSPFWRNLEYFLYRVHSSGMLQYYESTAFDFAVHAGLVQRFNDNTEYTSAGMQHLLMVFMLLALMCGVGLCVFVVESLWHYYKTSSDRKNKRI